MFKNAKILYVNLTEGKITTEALDGDTYKKYPGGSALGMYLLLKNMDPRVDPLSADNVLVFTVSPLTGMPISGNSRMNAAFKSPLTGTAGDSQVGGYIPAALAGNGYDGIVIKGRSEKPVYLYINKDDVTLRDASKFWGMVTGDAEKAIYEDIGDDKLESSIIGPAGENLVKYANIMHMRSRANGRNGGGAVMGSKNLKAIVVHKAPAVKAFDPAGFKTLTGNIKERMAANEVIVDLTLNGSGGVVDGHGAEGFLPSYNWDKGNIDGWKKIGGNAITKTILKKRETCFACAIRCKREVEIPGKVDIAYGGPEYETLATFGSYCGVDDLADICEANMLCNMYGMDTISCGATIAWAMDAYEKEVLTKEHTGGIELTFSNSSIFKDLIPKIGNMEPGIGELLARGSYEAAKTLGPEAMDLVVTSKKQEWPAHMVQMKPNLAINYSANPFGADHQSSEHDPALMAPEDDQNWLWPNMLETFDKIESYGTLNKNTAKFAGATQKFYSMMDTLCLCQFAWGPAWQLYGPNEVLDYCKYGAGWDASLEELQEVGERRINMMRLFNAKVGFDRKDDNLPKKAFLPIEYGEGEVAKITAKDYEAALTNYYEYMGWDPKTGNPTPETIKRLGLEWI
ncbi:MAG: aldehyde ferredoxin oxidoreductase family protein [Anaerovoracaceae bacterium]|jgi:aldehyde:ferredoxin oxidoreductase|nr:aldehyde ferredoxin oxidoreductase family protein [Anaerovoracaceae bacterium]